jgi:hypothetical protein
MGKNVAAQAGESSIKKFSIMSNYGEQKIDFANGLTELMLYESLFDSTVRARAIFADTGYGSGGGSVTESDRKNGYFNKSSGEKTELVVTDGYQQKLSYVGNYHLRTRQQARDVVGDSKTTNSIFATDFYSKESIDNHLVKNRVTLKYEGKPSDSVYKILKEVLKTPKNVVVFPSLNNFNFLGYNEKVFHKCTWLCKHSVPELEDAKGKLAGYLFYEIADDGSGTGGYRFDSIDNLFKQKPKRKMILNNTMELPPGYDTKILNHHEMTTVDIETHLTSGSLMQRELTTFEPFNKVFDSNNFSYKDQNFEWNNAGTEFYKLATDLNLQEEATRLSTRLWDTGTVPTGFNWDEQQPESKEFNFDVNEIIRQASNRVNQLFTTQITIIIPMDFGIHVGDLVHCDFPEISSKATREVSDNKSGIYMIMDLAHRITKTSNYTSLLLVRDTLYRKSSSSTGSNSSTSSSSNTASPRAVGRDEMIQANINRARQ